MTSLLRKLGYIAAAIIIFAAVIVCATSLLTPVVNKNKSSIENLATEMLHVPVSIQSVKLSWRQYQPQISLHNVTILKNTSKEPQLHVNRVRIFFSLWQSLWQRKLVPDGIMIEGSNVNISQDDNGEFTIQGLPALNEFNQIQTHAETKAVEVIGWLSQQPYLILHNIDLHYTDKKKQKYYATLYNLGITNSGTQHSIAGKAVLHQDIPTEIKFELQATGNKLDLNSLHIRSYLYVSGASLPQWVKDYSWQHWQIKQGLVTAKIWFEWNEGALQHLQSTFQAYQLQLLSQTNNAIYFFNRLSGNMGWKREGDHEVFAGDEILIDMPSHLWPVTNFYIALKPDSKGGFSPISADFGYLDLNDLQHFLFAVPDIIPPKIKKNLLDLQLKGNLQNTTVVFPNNMFDWKKIVFKTNFTQLSFNPQSHYPGLRNISGKIDANGMTGKLTLNSHHWSLDFPSLFPTMLKMDDLTGDLKWNINNDSGLTVTASALQFLNQDAAFNLHGNMTFSNHVAPIADIQANFTVPRANAIARYLPTKIMDPDLAQWLQNAFLSGEVNSGMAVLRGSLADFPFDHHNGEFSVTANVNNISLRFAPQWPILEKINGKLAFTGRKMLIDLDHLETLNVIANRVQAEIPYFGADKSQILNVQSEIQTDFTHALNYVHASPLEQNLGKMFADVSMQGPLALKLGLMVPLANPDNIKVNGDIIMHDTEMNLVPWNLKLTAINGALKFTEATTTAQNIQARLFDKPFLFNLNTLAKTKTISIIRATFINQIDLEDWEKLLQIPISRYAKGKTEIKGQIDFSTQLPIELRLQSNLLGVAVNLPGNLKKSAPIAKDASLQLILEQKQALKIKMNYANELSAAAIVDNKFNVVSAELRLGKGEANWPSSAGIYLSGDFEVLDWDQIKAYVNQSGSTNVSDFAIRGIKVHTNKLIMAGQILNEVDIQITPKAKSWSLTMTSAELKGEITIPLPLTRQSIVSADLEKINWQLASDKPQTSLDVNVKTLPGLNLEIDDLILNDISLGQIQIKTSPALNGINIQTFHMSSHLSNVQATGSWTKVGNNTMTKIQGTASSGSVSELLNSFGFDVRNFIATKGKINFDLNWNKAPYNFSLASLNGSAKLDMGSGRIVDIGKQNDAKMGLGQLLSIFSLQTIPRRLSLDFSDVFSKGYTFDSLRGDFSFRNGDAYTSNFTFEGPVAKVGINGRIGLRDKDFNFTLIVTPYVTSSIPVAATATFLTGNPLIGLGAFAVNTLLGPQMSKATTYYYSVTGPWNNPVWKSIPVKPN